jgi:hypothetical protein
MRISNNLHVNMSLKLLASGANDCVVTNNACPDTKMPRQNVASKIFYSMPTFRSSEKLAGLVNDIDPHGEFSVPLLNACNKDAKSYPDRVQTFCEFPRSILYQADYEYAGVAVEHLNPGTYDGYTLFTSFNAFMKHIREMHVTSKLANFNVSPANVLYDSHKNVFRLMDWKLVAKFPRKKDLNKRITYLPYPPEAGFIRGNYGFPVDKSVARQWLSDYGMALATSIFKIENQDITAEIADRNIPLFMEFISSAENARVFTLANAKLWSGPYLGRFDSFGLGMVGGCLYSLSTFFPSVQFKNHVITLIAGLLSAVPVDNILAEAILYLDWILNTCYHEPGSIRDRRFDACFPVLRTAPIPTERASGAGVPDWTFTLEGGRKTKPARRSVSRKRSSASKRKLSKRRRSSFKRTLSKRRR